VLRRQQQGLQSGSWSQEGVHVHVDAQALRALLSEWKDRALDGAVPAGLRVMSQWELLIDDATDELSRLLDATDEQREALREIEHSIVQGRSVLSRLADDQQRAHSEMLAVLTETEAEKRKHSELAAGAEEAREELGKLKAQCVALSGEQDQEEKAVAALREEERRLHGLTASSREEALAAEAEARKASQDTEEARARKAAAKLELEHVSNQLAAVQPELDARLLELSRAQSALAAAEGAVQMARLQLDSLEADVSDLERERAALERACRELEHRKGVVQGGIKERCAVAVQTVSRVTSAASDVACQALSDVRHAGSQCDVRTTGGHTTLVMAAAASAALDDEAQVVQEAINSARASLAEQRRKLQELHLQHSLRQAALDSEHATRRDELDAQLVASAEELRGLDGKVAEVRVERGEVQSALSDLMREQHAAAAQVAAKEAAICELDAQLATRVAEIHGAEGRVAELCREREALQKALADLRSGQLAAEAQLTVKEAAVSELEEQRVKRRAELDAAVAEAEAALRDARGQADAQRAKLQERQVDMQVGTVELQGLRGEVQAQKAELQVLRGEVQAQQEELQRTLEEAEVQKGKVQRLTVEVAALEAAQEAARDTLRGTEVARAAALGAWTAHVEELQARAAELRTTAESEQAGRADTRCSKAVQSEREVAATAGAAHMHAGRCDSIIMYQSSNFGCCFTFTSLVCH
jgi:chromosome segregation ATPase